MSAYKGHRGPNVSQYIATLNQLSPPQDLLADPAPVDEDFSAFLNADFFDVNSGRNVSVDFTSPLDFDVDIAADPASQPKTGAKLPPSTGNTSAGPNMDFSLNSKSLEPLFSSLIPIVLCLCRDSGYRNGRLLPASRGPMGEGRGA